MMKTANTFIRNLIRSVILLLCATGVLLTPPHAAHADTPTVSTIWISSDPGTDRYYKKGDKVQLTVRFSEAVTVTGNPPVASGGQTHWESTRIVLQERERHHRTPFWNRCSRSGYNQ